jgi:hypothetical protein
LLETRPLKSLILEKRFTTFKLSSLTRDFRSKLYLKSLRTHSIATDGEDFLVLILKLGR